MKDREALTKAKKSKVFFQQLTTGDVGGQKVRTQLYLNDFRSFQGQGFQAGVVSCFCQPCKIDMGSQRATALFYYYSVHDCLRMCYLTPVTLQ